MLQTIRFENISPDRASFCVLERRGIRTAFFLPAFRLVDGALFLRETCGIFDRIVKTFALMKGAFMNQYSRTVRGLNIATIVLSALGIMGALAVAIFMGIASTALNDPSVVNALVSQMQESGAASSSSAFDGSSAHTYSYDFSGMSQDELMAVAAGSIALMVGLSVGFLLCKVVCLMAGILAVRNYNNPAKLGGAFGWGIAAAVICLITGCIISMVLFIISVVFIGRLRKMNSGVPPYGCQQPQQFQRYQPGRQPGTQTPQQPVSPQQPQLQNGQQPAPQQGQQQVPSAPQQPTSGQPSDGEGSAEQK